MYWLALSGAWILWVTLCASIPTSLDTVYNATNDRKSLLMGLCEDLEKPNQQPTLAQDFRTSLHINDGHLNADVPQYRLPDPRKYEYALYPLEREVTTIYPQFFQSESKKQVQRKDQNVRVPIEGMKLGLPYDYVELEILVKGNKNLLWFNVAQCVEKIDEVYNTRAADVFFQQCAIHEDNYLQGIVQIVTGLVPSEFCVRLPSVVA